MAWFPLVGLVIGAMLAVADLLLSRLFTGPVVNALLVVLLVLLTRGLHQDGLADTLDGLAGGTTPADRRAIMRDPRVGAMGVTGLILSLGLRYVALLALPQMDRLPLLICMPAIGRWTMVLAARAAPYGRKEGGLGEAFLTGLSAREIILATVIIGSALFWMLGSLVSAVTLASAAALAIGWAAFSKRSFGGITGDTLGALNEIAEVMFLLAGPGLLTWR
jgi:adenosylcobinamide-GDP ribazoletransferase